jgi:hypothetical protein
MTDWIDYISTERHLFTDANGETLTEVACTYGSYFVASYDTLTKDESEAKDYLVDYMNTHKPSPGDLRVLR